MRLSRADIVMLYTEQVLANSGLSNSIAFAGASNVMCEAFWRTGKYDDALATLDSLDQTTSHGLPLRLQGTRYFNYGVVSTFRSELELAQINLQKALSIWRQLGHRRFEATTLNSLGLVAVRMEQFTVGEQNYQLALSLQEGMQHEYETARTRTNMAHLAIANEDYAHAIDLCIKNWGYYKNTGDLESMAITLNNLGWAYYKIGTLDMARRYLTQAIDYARQSNDKLRELLAMSNLGEVFVSKNLVNEAIDIFSRAQKEWAEFGRLEFANVLEEKIKSLHKICATT